VRQQPPRTAPRDDDRTAHARGSRAAIGAPTDVTSQSERRAPPGSADPARTAHPRGISSR